MSHVSSVIYSPEFMNPVTNIPKAKSTWITLKAFTFWELPMVQNETWSKFFHVNSYLWLASQLLELMITTSQCLLTFCCSIPQQLSALQPISPPAQCRNSGSACAWVSFPLRLPQGQWVTFAAGDEFGFEGPHCHQDLSWTALDANFSDVKGDHYCLLPWAVVRILPFLQWKRQ